MTITEVRVAPDLRDAIVFVSIVGDETYAEERLRWLRKQAFDIREEISRRIVLKFLPKFDYRLDLSVDRGVRLLSILDEIDREDAKRHASDKKEDKS